LRPLWIWILSQLVKAGLPDFIGKPYQNWKNGKNTKWPQNVPNSQKIYQLAVKYYKCTYNIATFSIPKPSKIYTDWDFWFENIPSSNPK
jgi:hypothetical protein